MSLSPLGRCHSHPLVPTEAPWHPDHPRAHSGTARSHPHLGQQGQVQQEECPGGEQGTAGGTLVTRQGPHVAHRAMPHLSSSSQQWCREWKWGHWGHARVGVRGHCSARHCHVLMGTEKSPRAIPAPRGALHRGEPLQPLQPPGKRHRLVSSELAPGSATSWFPNPGACGSPVPFP